MAWLLCDNVTCMCLSSSSLHLVYHSVIRRDCRCPLYAGSTTTCTRRHPCISATNLAPPPACSNPASDLESSWRALRGAARQVRCPDGRWWDVRVRETWAAREGRAVGRVGCVVVAVAWRSCRAVSAVGGRASHSEFSGLTNPAGLNSLRYSLSLT